MAQNLRRVFEEGHKRKFLVIVDDSEEFDAALMFAARVTQRTDGQLVFMYVIEPGSFQHWIGVEEIRREEEMTRARALFRLAQRKLTNIGCGDLDPEELICEGTKADEIVRAIEEDEDIAVFVLGASNSQDGPGPLVSTLATGKGAGTFPIPIYVVPGTLTAEEIVALA